MPEAVLTASGVQQLDARLAQAGLLDLAMEEAGRAVADTVQAFYPHGTVLLLAGSGANGGDALVAARHLHALEREVQVLATPARHALTRLNRRRLSAIGLKTQPLTLPALQRAVTRAAVAVDALLGTGFRPPLRGATAQWIETLSGSGVPVVAVDLPSGLSAQSARVDGAAVRAAHTVTFSGWKPALLFGEAAHHAGQVHLATLRSPPGWAQAEAVALRPNLGEVGALLPKRYADAHKGTAGQVWVIGGHPGTLGAAALAGVGALRGGAGRVIIFSEAEVPLIVPELMAQRLPDLAAHLQALPAESRPDAVCIGMGLGPAAAELTRTVLNWGLPCVIDADALQPELAGLGHESCLWTPHPGEAARLLGQATSSITADPIGAARELQARYGGVVVLKGGPSVMAHQGGVWVSRGGHPGMASAGMGDTLAGLLAALMGQGLEAPQAALAGVTLHARAGERAARRYGYGLSATDVSHELGPAWQELEHQKESPLD